ncbi:MAG: ABC transporter ATP-binding protein [Candidatus Magasanikbacteria bacterium]|nr:ABC transporter ATP-binding protein [Candidatus Magasanikbacteria bacterium]
MLEVRDIKKSFGGIEALQGSVFTVEGGRTTAFIGPNGAGKTTLFDIISGFLKPDSGSVFFDHKDITALSPHERAKLGISRSFQQVRLFKYLSIFEHLRMVEDHEDSRLLKNICFKQNTDHTHAYEKILIDFGIERDPNTTVEELSYGQKKLLQILLALRMKHRLVLLDEPVAGVNKVIQDRIESLLLDLKKKGETILLIDHDMEFIRNLADHVIVLDAGVVLTQGKPNQVLTDKKVLEAYLGQ